MGILDAPPLRDGDPAQPTLRSLGTGAHQAAAGNDSRFAGGFTQEQIEDIVGAMMTDSATVDFTYNDPAGTITAVVTGLTSASVSDFAEAVRDRVGATLIAGSNITITVNDPGDIITIDITGLASVATSGAYTDLSGKPTLGNAAAKNTGTTAGTVAAGDDSRFGGGGSTAGESVIVIAAAGTAETIDMNAYRVFDLTLSSVSPCALTLAGGTAGQACWAEVIVYQDGTGSRPSPTFTNISGWDLGGNSPVMPAGPGQYMSFAVVTFDGGSFYWGLSGTPGPTTRGKDLLIPAARFPDGTAGNLPARPSTISSGGTATTNAPKPAFDALLFQDANDEHALWTFFMPADYIDSGTIRLKLLSKTATTGNMVFKASMARVTESTTNLSTGNGLFDAVSLSGVVALPGTTFQVVEMTITLPGSYTANQLVQLMVGRDADNASDTAVGDVASIGGIRFEYRGN